MKAFHSYRKTLLALLFLSLAAGLFAFPGITSLCPTESGQYVYYRDYTFPEETYIGFLQYDEGTYAIRYFTPVATNGALPIIELYFTLDTNVDYVEFTGEKIASPVTQNDTEVLNYLHDLLYEFASRRKKINSADFSTTVTSNEDFMQFGGNVTINWNFYIPVFNLRTITSESDEVLLEAVSTGKLRDNNDQSFVSFSGFENIPIIDDYYIDGIKSMNDYGKKPDIVALDDSVTLIGDSGLLQSAYSPIPVSGYSEDIIDELREYLNINAFEVLYPDVLSYFSLMPTLYLPSTELTFTNTSYYLKGLYPMDGYDLSYPFYMIATCQIQDLGLRSTLLLVSTEQYWKNPGFYENLVK